jgi:hypothetical protein
MRHLFLTVFAFVIALPLVAQDCSDLFISEYYEGRFQNKALEIYNPTNQPIEMTGNYRLIRWANGNDVRAAVENNFADLVGTIPAYGTWVITNGITQDDGFGFIDPILLAKANQVDRPQHPSVSHFNGDDAISLVKVAGVAEQVIDIFGRIGEQPSAGWTSVFPHTTGQGDTLTVDHSLIRKYEIKRGVSSNPTVFDPLAEWKVNGKVTRFDTYWDSLGVHSCGCKPLSRNSAFDLAVAAYPNPVSAGTLEVAIPSAIETVKVYSLSGQLLPVAVQDLEPNRRRLDVSQLVGGLYMVEVVAQNGQRGTQRVLINR